MTSKKIPEHSHDENVKMFLVFAWMLLILVSIVVVIHDFKLQTDLIPKISTLTQKYVFTEDECVEGTETILRTGYSHCETPRSQQELGIIYFCEGDVFGNPDEHLREIWISDNDYYWEWYKTECSYYCHTTQIQDGEECETVEKMNTTKSVVVESCAKIDSKFICMNYNISLWEKIEINGTVIKSIPVYTEEVCTPTYKTITTFCATADEINEALG